MILVFGVSTNIRIQSLPDLQPLMTSKVTINNQTVSDRKTYGHATLGSQHFPKK